MIVVLIPAYNEAANVGSVVEAIPPRVCDLAVFPIVFSDGSTDDTADVARAGGADVVELESNRGKTAVLRLARERALAQSADYVVFMDADGQHDPAALTELVAPVVSGNCDLTTGSRYAEDSARGCTPFNRYMVRLVTVWVLSLVLGARPTDPYCGYRCFSRRALEMVSIRGSGYQCELETLFEAARLGLQVREVPISRLYPAGFTKMGTHGGILGGRARVIFQYVATVVRKSLELRGQGARLQLQPATADPGEAS